MSSRLERYYRVNMTPYFIAERTPDDCVVIHSFQDIATTSHQLRRRLLQILRSGARIFDEESGREVSSLERGTLLKVLLLQEFLDLHST